MEQRAKPNWIRAKRKIMRYHHVLMALTISHALIHIDVCSNIHSLSMVIWFEFAACLRHICLLSISSICSCRWEFETIYMQKAGEACAFLLFVFHSHPLPPSSIGSMSVCEINYTYRVCWISNSILTQCSDKVISCLQICIFGLNFSNITQKLWIYII